MRYAPYEAEYAAVPGMSAGELLDYFLTRIVETEEVWGLAESGVWLTRVEDGKTILPLWPYQLYAQEVAEADAGPGTPNAESLEYFVFETLPTLIRNDIDVEVLPRAQTRGCLITPHRLLDILEGILDAGEYTLDG